MRSPFHLPVRSVDIGEYQDTFLICAVITILVIRTQLWLTNYPQLGGHGLHIAHLLWGGLLMMIAVGILISFVGRPVRRAGAVIGGIGFGFFIDELGKFVTSNNNYFFKPAAGLIYLIFVILYIATRQLQRRRGFTEREYLTNAFDMFVEAARHDLDEREKQRVLALLARADQSDPLVAQVRSMVASVPVKPIKDRPRWERLLVGARRRYFDLVERSWFTKTLIVVFTIWAVLTLLSVLTLVFGGPVSFINVCTIISSAVAGALTLVGVYELRRGRRMTGYRWFDRALMVQIFITEVFEFVESQFGAAFGLGITILLLITVRYMIRGERQLEEAQRGMPPGGTAAPAPA